MTRMKSIDYNLWMTLLKLLKERMPSIMAEYNMIDDLRVNPSYPRDLTDIHKPSIIIRKVDTEQSKIGMGNFVGQIYEDRCFTDVYGMQFDIMMQFDTITGGNVQTSMLSSMLSEDIFNHIMIYEGNKFTLYDFTKNPNNPSAMGFVQMVNPPYTTNIPDGVTRPNADNDYINATRQTFTIIQTITPKQEYVDLSKWIKQSFKITTN